MAKNPSWLNLLVSILLVDLIIAVIALVWSWVCSASLDTRIISEIFSMIYAQSVSDMNLSERTNLMMKDLYRDYGFSIMVFLSGGVAILTSVLLA